MHVYLKPGPPTGLKTGATAKTKENQKSPKKRQKATQRPKQGEALIQTCKYLAKMSKNINIARHQGHINGHTVSYVLKNSG